MLKQIQRFSSFLETALAGLFGIYGEVSLVLKLVFLPVFSVVKVFLYVWITGVKMVVKYVDVAGASAGQWLVRVFGKDNTLALEHTNKKESTSFVSDANRFEAFGGPYNQSRKLVWDRNYLTDFVRAIIVLYERIQNKSQYAAWQKVRRASLGSNADFSRTSSTYQAQALHPFGIFQQTKNILRLLLGALIPKTSTGTYAQATLLCSCDRGSALLTSPPGNCIQPCISSRNVAPLRWQNQGWRAFLYSDKGRQTLGQKILYVLLSGPVNTETPAKVVELRNSGQGIYSHYKPIRGIVKVAPMGHFAGVPWVAGKKMLLTPFLGVVVGFVFLFLLAPGSVQVAVKYPN